MEASQKEFRKQTSERIIDSIWNEWVSIGLNGTGGLHSQSTIVNVEPLIAATATVGRQDPRLFDGSIEWLGINKSWVNIERLGRIAHSYRFPNLHVLGAATDAAAISLKPKGRGRSKPRANGAVTSPEPLFWNSAGVSSPRVSEGVFAKWNLKREPLDARGLAVRFPEDSVATLQLRWRALVGVNARADLLCEMQSRESHDGWVEGTELAKRLDIPPRTAQVALKSMCASGFFEGMEASGRVYVRTKPTALECVWPTANRPRLVETWRYWFAASMLDTLHRCSDVGDAALKILLRDLVLGALSMASRTLNPQNRTELAETVGDGLHSMEWSSWTDRVIALLQPLDPVYGLEFSR